VLGRLFRLIWGDDVDPAIRGVLASAFAGTLAFSAFWSFIGIWAAHELEATSSQIGVLFFVDAIGAIIGGYVGGQVSDRIGRRRVMLFSWGMQIPLVLAFAAVGERLLVGIALVFVVSVVAMPGVSAGQAIVADLVAPERHEHAYAATRVAFNLGVMFGPPIGGLLLLGDHWTRLFAGLAGLAALAFAVAFRLLPARGAYAPEGPPERRSFEVIRGDRLFILFLAAGVLAQIVYFSFETALPISLTTTYGLSPSSWGFLVVVNAALVTFLQLRITRRVARFSSARKWIAAMVLMGFPFLLLSANASLAAIVVVLVVFVIGEMLWAPTSQAIAARLAPADVRGAYMGAFTSTGAVAFAIGPFAGLQLRDASGDTAMWGFFALVSVAAALLGAWACRLSAGRPASVEAATA
jgi:predicted MFS family arabinose efflux permease